MSRRAVFARDDAVSHERLGCGQVLRRLAFDLSVDEGDPCCQTLGWAAPLDSSELIFRPLAYDLPCCQRQRHFARHGGEFSAFRSGKIPPFLLVLLALCAISCAGAGQVAVPRHIEQEQLPQIEVAAGFMVEKVLAVPPQLGSWICLTVDPEGRLIASAQAGLLYRITLRAGLQRPSVEPIRIYLKDRIGRPIGEPIGSAQGLRWAFGSLYVVVNGTGGLGSGLYRIRSTRPGGPLDSASLLTSLPGGGEHGPHGLEVDPSGKFLYVVSGNDCGLPNWKTCKVPRVWGGDQLLSPKTQRRDWHSKNGAIPGGWVCRTDPEGRRWEIVCAGFRNTYRLAFSPEGELFTADGDNEWQIGMPSYRAPRICHVRGGGDFGWRSGSQKLPPYFPDTLSGVVDLPKGGPTGIVMGTGAKFPAKYQRALFVLDWAYGKIYAAFLSPMGSTYTASLEVLLSGRPLPVADAVVGKDGALYFVVGGRGIDSGIFRVTYIGPDSTDAAPAVPNATAKESRRLRHILEDLQAPNSAALDVAWPMLGSADPSLRAAARAVIEHQKLQEWENRFFQEGEPQAILTGALALARCGGAWLQGELIDKLGAMDWNSLSSTQRIELLRAYGLCFIRMGKPPQEMAEEVSARLNEFYPSGFGLVDRELSRLLVYLGSPEVIEKTLLLVEHSAIQEDQLHFGCMLDAVEEDWSVSQRERFLCWLSGTDGFVGGREVPDTLDALRKRLSGRVSEVGAVALIAPELPEAPSGKPDFSREWTLAELLPDVEKDLRERNFEQGRQVFVSASCTKCHYFNGFGTEIGPDLTPIVFRLSKRKILESIIEPNKVIVDPYSTQLLTFRSGEKSLGRILCETNGKYQFAPDPAKPEDYVDINKADVVSVTKSTVSIMPEKLLRPHTREEILDLLAYLISGGDPHDRVFQKRP